MRWAPPFACGHRRRLWEPAGQPTRPRWEMPWTSRCPSISIAIAAARCCALVAGLLFAFAVVVMPGLRWLGDREFPGAFRAVDGVIQAAQPVFLAV